MIKFISDHLVHYIEMSALLEFFDNIDRKDYIWVTLSSMLAIITGFIIGFSKHLVWIWGLAIVLLVIFIAFSLLVYYANYRWKKTEVQTLTTAPSFPAQDFCEVCGKPLENGEEKIQNDLLIIVCPYCNAENVVKGEKL